MVGGFERGPKAEHLVDNAPSRPYVRLFIIPLLLDLFGTHIIWCADVSICEDRFITHDTTQAEVAQLYVLVSIEEDVAGLQVSMKNLVAFFAHVALE